MTEDNFCTFLCESERILNDRPLTPISNDPDDWDPLTPNMILLLRGNNCASLGQVTRDERHAFNQAQTIADDFWKRWRREYLPLLQSRQKHILARRNLQVDDLVLMTDEGKKRGDWPIARVVKVHFDSDGRVRTVDIKQKKGGKIKRRPINKLALLEASE